MESNSHVVGQFIEGRPTLGQQRPLSKTNRQTKIFNVKLACCLKAWS